MHAFLRHPRDKAVPGVPAVHGRDGDTWTFIDGDTSAPGTRLGDVAYLADHVETHLSVWRSALR